jgi:hypothetical protein
MSAAGTVLQLSESLPVPMHHWPARAILFTAADVASSQCALHSLHELGNEPLHEQTRLAGSNDEHELEPESRGRGAVGGACKVEC